MRYEIILNLLIYIIFKIIFNECKNEKPDFISIYLSIDTINSQLSDRFH